MTFTGERQDYEQRYLHQLREWMAEGVGSAAYDVTVKEINLWREGSRTWIYVLLNEATRPECEFGRAGPVWCDSSPTSSPEGAAGRFELGLLEQLDARGLGLPVTCEPRRVRWLHPYGQPPWQREVPEEEPEREDYERRFLDRMHQLLGTSPRHDVTPGDVKLYDRRGETFATLTFRVAGRPGCTFARSTTVWIGYLVTTTPESRAETLYRHFVEGLDRIPERCEPGGLTWYGETPSWLKYATPRG